MKKLLGYIILLSILPLIIGTIQQLTNGWGFWTAVAYTLLAYAIIWTAHFLYAIAIHLITSEK